MAHAHEAPTSHIHAVWFKRRRKAPRITIECLDDLAAAHTRIYQIPLAVERPSRITVECWWFHTITEYDKYADDQYLATVDGHPDPWSLPDPLNFWKFGPLYYQKPEDTTPSEIRLNLLMHGLPEEYRPIFEDRAVNLALRDFSRVSEIRVEVASGGGYTLCFLGTPAQVRRALWGRDSPEVNAAYEDYYRRHH